MGSKRNSRSTVATDFAKSLYTYTYTDSDSNSNANSNSCGTDQPDRYRSIVESDPAVVD